MFDVVDKMACRTHRGLIVYRECTSKTWLMLKETNPYTVNLRQDGRVAAKPQTKLKPQSFSMWDSVFHTAWSYINTELIRPWHTAKPNLYPWQLHCVRDPFIQLYSTSRYQKASSDPSKQRENIMRLPYPTLHFFLDISSIFHNILFLGMHVYCVFLKSSALFIGLAPCLFCDQCMRACALFTWKLHAVEFPHGINKNWSNLIYIITNQHGCHSKKSRLFITPTFPVVYPFNISNMKHVTFQF